VITVLSGMSAIEQLEDNVKTAKSLTPLTDAEQNILREAVKILNSTPRVPCTACRYCVENCPQKINIPGFLDLYNNYLKYKSTANSDFSYMMAAAGGGKPSACIKCRVCEGHCPQHIEISEEMSKIAAIYEK
jgi:predicted aldo/keto reductase-like oxidoreductase